ncbi:MAG: ornithine carbamoyltransferase, partial [Chloroflexota bacterium]
SVPVINGLSDISHPCQALADFLTIREKKGRLDGITLAFFGDGDNNVAHSLLMLASKVGTNIRFASPAGYGPGAAFLLAAKQVAAESGARIEVTTDPYEAAAGADVLYTDVWASMGQEAEANARQGIFRPFQLNESVVAAAKPDAIVMHDLPAHRGEEISGSVIDGPNSVVFDQAENRLHAQKAVLFLFLGAGEA